MSKIPTLLEKKYSFLYYDKTEWEEFFNSIKFIDSDISNKTLHVYSKTISQNKLREKGFVITRSADKADAVVIRDFKELKSKNVWNYFGSTYNKQDLIMISDSYNVEEFFTNYNPEHLYILDKELYKYVYSYKGDYELFNNCKELLATRNESNIKMAMEFMANADWNENEIYLKELFSSFWLNHIRYNSYKNSISFKGFLASLDFDHTGVHLNDADDYRDLCKNDEHHNYVYNKFKEDFENSLKDLIKTYKIKIDNIQYSIDKSFNYTENETTV